MITRSSTYIQCWVVNRRARGQEDRSRHSVAPVDVAMCSTHHLDRLDAEEVTIDRIIEHGYAIDKESGGLPATTRADTTHVDRRGETRAVVRHVKVRHYRCQVRQMLDVVLTKHRRSHETHCSWSTHQETSLTQ